MNPETGEIISRDAFKEILELKNENEIKKYVPLNEELEKKLVGMNRHGRRKYYALHKEEFNNN